MAKKKAKDKEKQEQTDQSTPAYCGIQILYKDSHLETFQVQVIDSQGRPSNIITLDKLPLKLQEAAHLMERNLVLSEMQNQIGAIK